MRICFFGDSFVNGTGDDDCLGWPGRVCAAVRRKGHDVTLYNLGVRRDTSADIARRWRREAAARLPVEQDGRLVFSFGANDCTPEGNGVRVPHDQALGNAYEILAEASDWLPTLMVGPAPVGDDRETDERIAVLSHDLRAVCAKIEVPYLEVFGILADDPVWRREAAGGDGTHPNRGGYTLLSNHIAAWESWRRWFDKP